MLYWLVQLMTFAEQLIAYGEKLGLSRAEIAQLLDVTERTVYLWESGDRDPKACTQEGALHMLDWALRYVEAVIAPC